MGRGLDGLISRCEEKLCSFEGPSGLAQFPVAIAWGKHLFPFRTEQLSPTAPMVLGSQGPGRVGRRRSFYEPPTGRLVVVLASERRRPAGMGGGPRSACDGPAAARRASHVDPLVAPARQIA